MLHVEVHCYNVMRRQPARRSSSAITPAILRKPRKPWDWIRFIPFTAMYVKCTLNVELQSIPKNTLRVVTLSLMQVNFEIQKYSTEAKRNWPFSPDGRLIAQFLMSSLSVSVNKAWHNLSACLLWETVTLCFQLSLVFEAYWGHRACGTLYFLSIKQKSNGNKGRDTQVIIVSDFTERP